MFLMLCTVGIEGLCTVMSTLVDYKGARYLCQSIVPGIINAGEASSRLMYGVIEDGHRLTVRTSPPSLSPLSRTIEQKRGF